MRNPKEALEENKRLFISMALLVAFIVCATVFIDGGKEQAPPADESVNHVSAKTEDVKEKDKLKEEKDKGDSPTSKPKVVNKEDVEPLPDIDTSLLDNMTYDSVSKHYKEVMTKVNVTEEQFKYVLMDDFAKLLTKVLNSKIEGQAVDKETAIDLYIKSNLVMSYIYNSGIYTEEEFAKSSWTALLTTMSMLEIHAEGFKEYPLREEMEFNHLGTLATTLVQKDNLTKLGYILTEDVHVKLSELIVNEEFTRMFTEKTKTLKEKYESESE